MRDLSDFLAGRAEMNLDRAALILARVEYPDLAPAPYFELLDSHCAEFEKRATSANDGPSFVRAMNQYLFQELGFRGNTDDYYNPANSCLNEVLTARVGIPISLSVMYLELARRLERPVAGIGLPGHFVIRYDDGDYATYIDPFHGGRLLDVPDCLELAARGSGGQAARTSLILAPVTPRQIVSRMVNNLRGIYFSRRAHRKALAIMNLLLESAPDAAEEHKQRGLVYLQLGERHAARLDFERYLALAPDASDRADIERQLGKLKRWVAGLN